MHSFRKVRIVLPMALAAAAWHARNPELVAATPGWWTTRNVYKMEEGNPVPANDHAVANQGQLKHVAIAAYEHLVEALAVHGRKVWEKWDGTPSTVGDELCAMIEAWVVLDRGPQTGNTGRILRMELINGQPPEPPAEPTYDVSGTGPMQRTAGALNHQDYRAMTQGQAKAVAKKFYLRLDEIYQIQTGNGVVQLPVPAPWRGGVPWTEETTDDANHALANIGQLKALFAFDLNGDSNADGITDINSIADNEDPFTPVDTDGDGLTNKEEGLLGTNPNVKDNPAVQLSVTGFVLP